MKSVILAGGLGTRLSEATNLIPKPMVEIGGKPILWHIMKIYAHYGIKDFVVCCGYKQYVIKEYFVNYFRHNCDLTVNLADDSVKIHKNRSEDWNVTLIDTGLNTMTGGRVKRIQKYIGNERFCLTYGDGVSDIDISAEIAEHERSRAALTMMAYQPRGKFGGLEIDAGTGTIRSFAEKPKGDGAWVNAGFFICEPEVFNFIPAHDDKCILERAPLENIARAGKMHAYKHRGFWQPMDTLRDNTELNALWADGNAPWKVW